MQLIESPNQLTTVNKCLKWLSEKPQCVERDRTIDMLKTIIKHYDRDGSSKKGLFHFTAIPERLFEKYMELLDE